MDIHVSTDNTIHGDERVIEVAEKYGNSPAQIAIAWLLSKPGVCSPVVGVSRVEQIEHHGDSEPAVMLATSFSHPAVVPVGYGVPTGARHALFRAFIPSCHRDNPSKPSKLCTKTRPWTTNSAHGPAKTKWKEKRP